MSAPCSDNNKVRAYTGVGGPHPTAPLGQPGSLNIAIT